MKELNIHTSESGSNLNERRKHEKKNLKKIHIYSTLCRKITVALKFLPLLLSLISLKTFIL